MAELERQSKSRRLFAEFHSRGIPYCHFKSNEHLREGLRGVTDLDVLVDRDDEAEIRTALNESGFKRLAFRNRHPGTEFHLAYDREFDRFVFLHLHFQLVLGDREKGYQFRWEDRLLSTRTRDPETGVYVTDPHLELLLLFVRYALKIDVRAYLRVLRGDPYPDENVEREFEWLRERVDRRRVVDLAADLLNPASAAVVDDLVDGMTVSKLRKLRSKISPEVHVYRRQSTVENKIRKHVRALAGKSRRVSRRLGKPYSLHRTLPSGGVVVAFVGADGSGKSTMAETTESWLSWKLDVDRIYFGKNDTYTLPKKLLVGIKRAYSSTLSNGDGRSEEDVDGNAAVTESRSLAERAWRIPWAIAVSHSRRKKLKRMWRTRNKGGIVITDRYPQNQVMGNNDGPLLSHWADSRLPPKRAIAAWEARPYEWAEKNPPDLIVKLDVDPEVALERTDATDVEELRTKTRIVEGLEFERSENVSIDGNRPLESVVLDVKRAVWDRL